MSGLPPFQGGAAGYIGYDYGAVLERLPAPRYDDLAIPDVMLGLYDWVIAWDHRLGTAWLVSTGLPETGAARERAGAGAARDGAGAAARPARPAPRVSRRQRRWRHRDRRLGARPTRCSGVEGAEAIGLRSTFTHRGYLDAVARVREYIVAGDIFQANLSQRFQAPLAEPPFELYTGGSGAGTRRRSPPISTSASSRC